MTSATVLRYKIWCMFIVTIKTVCVLGEALSNLYVGTPFSIFARLFL